MQAIRTISGKEVRILNWYSGNALYNLRIFGPEKLGGLGDSLERAHALAETTGENVDEVVEEVWIPSTAACSSLKLTLL